MEGKRKPDGTRGRDTSTLCTQPEDALRPGSPRAAGLPLSQVIEGHPGTPSPTTPIRTFCTFAKLFQVIQKN